ncbi:hypothetical protein OG259_07700 [Streptomyces sp. NBC_00250]|uniref:hypothetical protein n=1 Tax=Streptomyces sp. NBC_00250 TaxID=2903641 RepID=UPI002E27F7B6|nr:hypothetical protein [Streptomyces sp. NBC_00250]
MKLPEGPAVTDISAGQALAAACEGLAVLALEKRQAGSTPETDAQLDALLAAAAVIAQDIREDA